MKHQWEKHQWEDMRDGCVRCVVCDDLVDVLGDRSPSAADDIAGTCLAVGPEPLVQITEDLWVNPAQVAFVETDVGGVYDGTPVRRVTAILFANGKQRRTDQPLHEVVALLNGSA